MAYSVVPTVATGDVWTAAYHNTYIRDNFAAGAPGLFTTKGDLVVATGVNAAGRLAAGPIESILVSDPAAYLGMKWLLHKRAQVKRSTDYNPSLTTYKIPWETENYDDNNFWSVADPENLVIQENGFYLVSASVYLDVTTLSNSSYKIDLFRNSTILATEGVFLPNISSPVYLSLVWLDQFLQSDKVSLNVFSYNNVIVKANIATLFGICRWM